jgi:hypothetical protein
MMNVFYGRLGMMGVVFSIISAGEPASIEEARLPLMPTLTLE